ncbi:hypothetical protein AVEN_56566-1 [Araneus ventricosus]|uniref:Uncharacterized protein n=1 Tax=Araneus ventricosus TaxID=182803 RepID=A0A4Y2QNS5_ARAVE|nr:hypothetical protein AVEN_56566-1 [Araneus ventricosus]
MAILVLVEDEPPELLGKQQKSSSSDVGTFEGQLNSALNSANKASDSSEAQTVHLKNGRTPLSLMPQTSISSKSSSANGDIPRHSVDNSHNDTRLLRKLNTHVADDTRVLKRSVPEEIVIDDSDDEVVEIEDLSLSRTSKSSVQHSHRGLSTEKDSQVNL